MTIRGNKNSLLIYYWLKKYFEVHLQVELQEDEVKQKLLRLEVVFLDWTGTPTH